MKTTQGKRRSPIETAEGSFTPRFGDIMRKSMETVKQGRTENTMDQNMILRIYYWSDDAERETAP